MEAEELRFKLTIVEETHDELEDSYELQATGCSSVRRCALFGN